MSTAVFLSHAAADSALAAEFSRLLATGLEITGKSVFCSSLPGRTIPGGFNFVEHIKKNLENCKVVVLLITENYLASQFCLAELGAAWISKDQIIPLVIPPFTRGRLTATLSIKQAWRIDDDDDLNSLADDLKAALGFEINLGQWGVEKKAFLKNMEVLIKEQIPPKVVDPAEFEQIREQLSYGEGVIEDLRSKIDEKDVLIEAIKATKNREETRAVELASLSEMDGFQELAAELTRAVNELPTAAQEALFHSVRGEPLPAPDVGYSNSDDQWRDIRFACQKNMLIGDPPLSLNEDHPKVRKALEAVSRLSSFMDEKEDVLRPLIEEEYEVTYTLGDEDFWGQFVG